MNRFMVYFMCVFFLVPRNGWSYIDPGTGSYLFQLFLAFFLGAAFMVANSWRKLVAFIRSWFTRSKDGGAKHE